MGGGDCRDAPGKVSLASQGFRGDGKDDDGADDDLLQEGRHVQEIEAVAQHADDQDADQRAADGPGAAGERRAADDHRRDRVELVAETARRLDRVQAGGEHDAGEARKQRGEDVDGDGDVLHVDAGEAELFDTGTRLRDTDTPEHELLRQEIERTVMRVVEGLPEELRAAITLREVDGLSYEDIAQKMGCPIGTVRSRIFRAREAIDTELRPLLDHDTAKATKR